jgi:hypothetical protein
VDHDVGGFGGVDAATTLNRATLATNGVKHVFVVACEGDADADAQARVQARALGVIFYPATGVNADAVGQAHDLWAVLIAPLCEVFPLVCPICGGPMRIIAFITHSAYIRQILNHIGVEAAPPRITPARGPPLWDGCDAQIDEGEPDWDERPKWHRTSRPISASVGEARQQRF